MSAELFAQMKVLVEESKSRGLFSSFHADFYANDKDVIENDMQAFDCWLFIIKECGTYLSLISKYSPYIKACLSDTPANHRYFIISVKPGQQSTITEYCSKTIAGAVAKVPCNENRVPRREFARPLMGNHWPSLADSRLYSDMTFTKGEEVFLHFTANSVTYAIPKNANSRTLAMPFDVNRQTGFHQLTITSAFGHATLTPITAKQFNAAVRKANKQHAKAA